MNCKKIVVTYLRDNGYDGLAGDGCGCSLDDLMPCWGEQIMECEPGHVVPGCIDGCEAGGGCDFHVIPGKASA